MSQLRIPLDVKEHVNARVAAFNKRHRCKYMARYEKDCLYLDRDDDGLDIAHICRLNYKGKIDKWGFAIYKYSRDAYDKDEWFFPGTEEVDGTVEGAMRAGLKAYPV